MFKPSYQLLSASNSNSGSVSPASFSNSTPPNEQAKSNLNTKPNLLQVSQYPTSDTNKKANQPQEQHSTNRQIRKIVLKKSPIGFGIAISEDRYNRLIVRGLNPNGVAFTDGRMQIGDEIIAVNDCPVNTMKYDEVMNLLHKTLEPVEFQVTKPELMTAGSSSISTTNNNSTTGSRNISRSPSSSASPVKVLNSNQHESSSSPQPLAEKSLNVTFSKSLDSTPPSNEEHSQAKHSQISNINNDPRTNVIRIGEETLIEIERGKLGLGLSIVGGSDTQLPGIIIHDIYQNGAAYRDKRLAIGDQILKVNNIDLTNATHEQALNSLRQTSDFVKLLIHRGFNSTTSFMTAGHQQLSNTSNATHGFGSSGFSQILTDEKCLNIINVDLNKKFAKGLGFSIIGRRDGSGVFISHIIEGGCAHKDGRLMIGDLILEVNNIDIRKSQYNDVAFLLKTLPQGKVNLKIGRFKTSANNSTSNSANQSGTSSKATSRRNSITNQTIATPSSPTKTNAPQQKDAATTSTFKSIVKK